eukprot:jgi/Orpsp1_1/1186712/evm.model.d7180000052714.1
MNRISYDIKNDFDEIFFNKYYIQNNKAIYMKKAENAFNSFKNKLEKVNILVAGKTGVGKSTLINAIFNQDIHGKGNSITQYIDEISIYDYPISIITLNELELKDYKKVIIDIENYINKCKYSENTNTQIHAAWVCIAEGNARIEVAEKELVEMLSQFMPVIIVITKLNFDQGLQSLIRKECPKAKAVIRVQSKSIPLDDGYVIKPKNLEELVKLTNQYLPESVQKAFVLSQKKSIELLEMESLKIIKFYMAASEVMHKESDMIYHGICLIIEISNMFKINEIDKKYLVAISIIFFCDKSSNFKKFIKKVFKFVPGIHSKISSEKASSLVKSFGNIFLESLLKEFKNNPKKEFTENEMKGILYEIYINSKSF